MVLTVIPMAINVMTGVAVWMSDLSLLAKIIITIILIVKFALYVYTALIDGGDLVRSFGLATCILLNVALAVYFAATSVWYAIPGCAVLAILAVAWGRMSGFSFKKEE